jgi:hypothetical protein
MLSKFFRSWISGRPGYVYRIDLIAAAFSKSILLIVIITTNELKNRKVLVRKSSLNEMCNLLRRWYFYFSIRNIIHIKAIETMAATIRGMQVINIKAKWWRIFEIALIIIAKTKLIRAPTKIYCETINT